DAGNDWEGIFTGYPLTDSDGNTIDYSITEDPVDGYETEVSGSLEDGFTVTNRQIDYGLPVETLHVQKKWVGDNTESRPDTVAFIVEVAYEGGSIFSTAKLEVDSETGELISVQKLENGGWVDVPLGDIDGFDHQAIEDGFQFELKVSVKPGMVFYVTEETNEAYETTVDQDGNYF